MIAEILDRFEPSAIGWTVLGVVAFILIVAATFTALNQGRKFFARHPSLSEILKGLATIRDLEEHKEEHRLRCVGLEKQISETRHSFDERANSDLVRMEKTFLSIFARSEERDRTISELSNTVSALHERSQSAIRHFDALFSKFDRLAERMGK